MTAKGVRVVKSKGKLAIVLARVVIAAAAWGASWIAGSPGWASWDVAIIVYLTIGAADYVVRELGGRR